MENKEKIRKDALEEIIDCLEDDYISYYRELQERVFAIDYYISSEHAAIEALTDYGLWDAIEEVQEYEQENYGEIKTKLGNPRELINMLFYIIGEQILSNSLILKDNWDDRASDEINQAIIEELRES